MVTTPRVIQALILFSAALGVLFLWQAYPLLPPLGFYIVAAGWVLFVIDGALTFYRPRPSFVLGFALALLALAASVGEPEHLAILQGTDILAKATLVVGDAAELLLVITVPYYFYASRKKDEWAWPGAKSQA